MHFMNVINPEGWVAVLEWYGNTLSSRPTAKHLLMYGSSLPYDCGLCRAARHGALLPHSQARASVINVYVGGSIDPSLRLDTYRLTYVLCTVVDTCSTYIRSTQIPGTDSTTAAALVSYS